MDTDEFDFSNLYYTDDKEEIYSELREEMDKFTRALTKEDYLGSLHLVNDKISLFGKGSALDEIRCTLHSASLKKDLWRDNYEVSIPYLKCDLVTGKGGKELWVSIISSTELRLKNERGSTLFFNTKTEADKMVDRLNDDPKNNGMIRDMLMMMHRYADDYSDENMYENTVSVSLDIKEAEGNKILG